MGTKIARLAALVAGIVVGVCQLPVYAQPCVGGASSAAGEGRSSRFLYVDNSVPGDPPVSSISGFGVDASGALTPIAGSPFPTGGGGGFPGAVDGLACCGRFLYATGPESASVSGFAVDPTSGALAPVPGSPFTTSPAPTANPHGLACTPDHSLLYAANNSGDPIAEDIRIFSIDPSTGALSPNANDPFDLPPGSAFPIDLEMNATGTLLLVSQVLTDELHGSVGVYRVAAGGALSPVSGSPFAIAGLGSGGVLTPDQARYYVANNETSISGFAVGSDGTLTALSGSPFPYPANDVATDETGSFLFASDATHGTHGRIHVLKIDRGTGGLSPVSGSPFDNDSDDRPGGLASTGRFLFVANGYVDAFANTASVYSFDPTEGALASAPGSPFDRGVAFPGSPAAAIVFCPNAVVPPPTATATVPLSTPTPTATGPQCVGDCDGDGNVTIDELIRGVNIALGTLALDACPSFDTSGDGQVTVDEIIRGVNNALGGCSV